MRTSRRMQRLAQIMPKEEKMNLTSLMDVFTILVFFLLVNSGSTELLDPPKKIVLPESISEAKPRETVIIDVNKDEVLVQGEPVVRMADIVSGNGKNIEPIMKQLAALRKRVIGAQTEAVSKSKEVTILADKSIPFRIIKQIMSSCTAQGYERISLAVIQKESQNSNI